MKTVEILMGDTTGLEKLVGEKKRADGWYGSKNSQHTIQITVAHFRGRIGIQGTLALNPTEEDWFFINLAGNKQYLEYNCKETQTNAYNITGNFVWLRAIMDRGEQLLPLTREQISAMGSVSRILLSR